MITLTILTIIGISMALCASFALGVSGIAFLLIFGDLVVCGVIVALIIKCIMNTKNDKK